MTLQFPHSALRSIPITMQCVVLVSTLVLFSGCGKEGSERTIKAESEGTSWLEEIFKTSTQPVINCEGLATWLSAQGALLSEKIEREAYTAELQYRPATCAACLEDRTAAFADENFRTRVSQLKRSELYVLRITESVSAEGKTLELTEALRNDLVQIIGTDTLECAFVHVEAMPSMLPFSSAIIGFDRPQDELDRRVVLLDRTNRHGGNLSFEFDNGRIGRFVAAIPDSLTKG